MKNCREIKFGPKYAEESLKKIFPDIVGIDNDDLNVEYRDYATLDDYKDNDRYGVLVLMYRDPLSVSIHYYDKNELVKFEIEMNSVDKIIEIQYRYDELTENVFKYFNCILAEVVQRYKVLAQMADVFNSRIITDEHFKK